MKVKKVVFVNEKIINDVNSYGIINRLEIIFEESKERPIIKIDAGDIVIEDKSFEIDCDEVLKKMNEINFNDKYNEMNSREYSGDKWKLIINDKKYEGILEDPYYVVKIKKIIRFNAIQTIIYKKLANYLKIK